MKKVTSSSGFCQLTGAPSGEADRGLSHITPLFFSEALRGMLSVKLSLATSSAGECVLILMVIFLNSNISSLSKRQKMLPEIPAQEATVL